MMESAPRNPAQDAAHQRMVERYLGSFWRRVYESVAAMTNDAGHGPAPRRRKGSAKRPLSHAERKAKRKAARAARKVNRPYAAKRPKWRV